MKLKLFPKTKVMRFSLIAFIAVIVLAFLSMGLLGGGLYFVASPLLALLLPNAPLDINAWHGDWVWPAMISMPLLWAVSFLIAGAAYLYFEKLDWTKLTLKTSYVVILLLWNIAIWTAFVKSITPDMIKVI